MKIIHKISKQVIDVPYEHAEILFRQGWEEDKSTSLKIKVEVDVPVIDVPEIKVEEVIPAFQQVEEAIKNRGRPKKNNF